MHVAALAQNRRRAMGQRLNELGERLDRTGERLLNSRALLAPWREALLRKQGRLQRALLSLLPARAARLDGAQQRLLRALQLTQLARTRTAQLQTRLDSAFANGLRDQRSRTQTAAQGLLLLNPQHVLDRGYALVFNALGQPVTDAASVVPGTALRIRVQRGEIEALTVAAQGHASDA
jgi:exodeoxyribonuclease VII large subunit